MGEATSVDQAIHDKIATLYLLHTVAVPGEIFLRRSQSLISPRLLCELLLNQPMQMLSYRLMIETLDDLVQKTGD